MPTCKNCGEVVGALEMKDGLCKKCATPENLEKYGKTEEKGSKLFYLPKFMGFNKRNLLIVGVLLLLNSMYLIISLFTSDNNLLEAIFTLIEIFSLIYFKILLNKKGNYFGVDYYIKELIFFNLVYILLLKIEHYHWLKEDIYLNLLMVWSIIVSIITIIIFVKLLNEFKDKLYGFLKPLSYIQIADSFINITFGLLMLGIFAGIINKNSDSIINFGSFIQFLVYIIILSESIIGLMFALIFFKASNQVDENGNFIT